MKKYFLFDCEMGGLNPKTSLLTLYGMVLGPKLEIVDTINLKMKPNNGVYHVTAKAMGTNKINLSKHDAEAMPIHEAAELFENFAAKQALGADLMIPAGHNLSLDIRFCKKYLLKSKNADGDCWHQFFSYRRLDTATLAHGLICAGKLPENLECSLRSLAAHFALDYSGAHDAEFDAKLTHKILKLLIKLMRGAA